MTRPHPAIGIGYRYSIHDWICANLASVDVLEITLDHCFAGSEASRAAIYDLIGRIPLTAHGIGLSIGTDAPLDERYLERVAEQLAHLDAPAYSEHLAFTAVPGRDLATFLPVPRTDAVAATIIRKVQHIKSRIPVQFLLENIACLFEWPDSQMSEPDFLNLICRETQAAVLLDIENLLLNSRNH